MLPNPKPMLQTDVLLSRAQTESQADGSKAGTEDTASFHNHDHDPTQTAQACNEACMSYQCKD